MRKIKSERNAKKIKNSMNDFYMYYIRHQKFTAFFKNLSNKELERMSDRIKLVVDDMYIKMRVEEKYMYWNNLSILYDLLCGYFNKKNKFLELLHKRLGEEEKVNETIEEKKRLDIIKNVLGYETAFSKEIYDKVDDCLYWFYICINRYLDYYHGRLKKDNPSDLAKIVDKIVTDYNLQYIRDEEGINREINYINNILSRLKYAKENTDVIFSIMSIDYDKKYKRMLKGTLTRVEKLMDIIISEIEKPYAA